MQMSYKATTLGYIDRLSVQVKYLLMSANCDNLPIERFNLFNALELYIYRCCQIFWHCTIFNIHITYLETVGSDLFTICFLFVGNEKT